VLFTRGGRPGDLDTLHPRPDSGSSGNPTCFR
jgi:hypothetical protein